MCVHVHFKTHVWRLEDSLGCQSSPSTLFEAGCLSVLEADWTTSLPGGFLSLFPISQ